MMNEQSTALITTPKPAAKSLSKELSLNNNTQVSAIARAKQVLRGYIPHLGMSEIKAIANMAGNVGRYPERDRLLVLTMADATLRVSECLQLRPRDIKQNSCGWYLEIFGKGSKPGIAAISPNLAAQLQAYAYRNVLDMNTRLFQIKRSRAFQIVQRATKMAGIQKPDHVGGLHVLRHSGALERLRETGNPRALQDQLRHATAQMTLRYMKTLSTEESLAIQQTVNFQW